MNLNHEPNFDHQRHLVHFIWASNRGQQVYDTRTVGDNKNLGFEKKPEFAKKKKETSFVKNLSFENIWVFYVFVHHHLIVKGNIFLRFFVELDVLDAL